MRVAVLAGGLAVLGSRPALAGCPEPSSLDALRARSRAIAQAIADGRTLTARDEARRLREEVRCLDVPLPDVDAAAALARAIGSGYVAGGEPAIGKPWLRTALDLDPEHAWTLPAGHPVRAAWDAIAAEPVPPMERASDDSLVDEAWLDGSPLETPAARLGRPHVLQLGIDPTETHIVFGNRFPSEVLGAPRPDPRPARRASAEASRSGADALVVDRLRPPEKTPLIASGVTLIVAAGGLYALAAQRRQRFDDPDGAGSLEELGALRNQVNGLVLASAATLVVGVSGATWGAFVDARGRARLRIRL